MKKIIYLFIFILSFHFIGNGQLSPIIGKADYPFLINLPSDTVLANKPPILVFLHGRSLSGNNLEIVKRYGVINEILRGRKIPAIVVAPQVAMGKGWEPDKVLNVIQYIQANYNTDSNRIYVAGMSLGGYGTLHFAGKYANIIAGAVALCGGGNTTDGCNLSEIPLWIQHGKIDRAVPISESEKIVDAIKSCSGGPLLKYTVYDNYGHGELERVFHSNEFYDWLFSQVKEPNDIVKNEDEMNCGSEGID